MALQNTQYNTVKFTCHRWLQKAVNSQVTAAMDADINIGNQVLVYRNKSNYCYGCFSELEVSSEVVQIKTVNILFNTRSIVEKSTG